MTTVSKNYPQALPRKFQGATLDPIKITRNKILIKNLTGSEPEMTSADQITDTLGV